MALHSYGTGRSDGHELTEQLSVNPMFARPGETTSVPKHRLPAGSMSPATAYQIVHDELMLDGNARLNLATFVTTWMEPQADRLMAECRDKNMIDKDEYPQTAELERRCVTMLAELWHAPGTVPAGRRSAARRPGPARQHARRAGAQAALAAAAPRGGCGHRPAQPGDGHQRPGLLGQVLQLLGGGAAPGADGRASGSTSTPSRRSRCATRTPSGSSRSSAPPSTAATSRSRRSPPPSTTCRRAPASTSRCTSTARPARWSRRSSTRTWCGTSGCPGSPRSTPPGTSTGWSTRASAGCCGGTPRRCPRSWSSGSTTSAARCRPSR